MADEKELEKETEVQEEELDLDDLEQVSGGAGLRSVKKARTTDIDTKTISRI